MKLVLALVVVGLLQSLPSLSAKDSFSLVGEDYSGEIRSIQSLRPCTIEVAKDNFTKRKFIVPDECKIATTNNVEVSYSKLSRGERVSVRYSRNNSDEFKATAITLKR